MDWLQSNQNNTAKILDCSNPTRTTKNHLKRIICRGQLKRNGTCAKTRFRLSAKRTNPFKSAGRQFSLLLAAELCVSAFIVRSIVGYTMFRGSEKGTGYPLHSPLSPSLPLPTSLCAITFQLESTNCCIHTAVPFNDGPRHPRNMKRLKKHTKDNLCIKWVLFYTYVVSATFITDSKTYKCQHMYKAIYWYQKLTNLWLYNFLFHPVNVTSLFISRKKNNFHFFSPYLPQGIHCLYITNIQK